MALDIVSHKTQTANPVTLLASPLGEEGHEVAKGWTVVILIMILDVDVTAERRHYNTHCPKGNPQPSGPKAPSNLRTLGPQGPIHLKNLFSATLLYKLPASAGHNLRAAGPSTL